MLKLHSIGLGGQSSLWRDVFIAAIRSGANVTFALHAADEAVKAYTERAT